ncbi:hypothetical protein Tco_0252145 [Tanacetum coccineum]
MVIPASISITLAATPTPHHHLTTAAPPLPPATYHHHPQRHTTIISLPSPPTRHSRTTSTQPPRLRVHLDLGVAPMGAFGSGFRSRNHIGSANRSTISMGRLRGSPIYYCLVFLEGTPARGTYSFLPSVLGGDTCEGYIFNSARVLMEGTPMMGTYGFHHCPGVLGGDTYDGYIVYRFHELRVIVIIVLYTDEYLMCLE